MSTHTGAAPDQKDRPTSRAAARRLDDARVPAQGDAAREAVHLLDEQPYQLLPPLTAEEYASLRDSIAMYGVLSPVIVDEDGHVLDGHHRVRVAAELGVTYPTTVLPGLTHEQKIEQALLLNVARRHLTVEQRRQLVADLRGRGLSVRFISDSTGIPRSTVHRDAPGVPGGTPGYVTGRDGKRYSPQRTYDPVSVWRAQWRAQGILSDRLPADGAQLREEFLRSQFVDVFPILHDAPTQMWDKFADDKLLDVAAAHMIRTGTLLARPAHWPAHWSVRPGPVSEANSVTIWMLRVARAAGEFLTWCDDVGITPRFGKHSRFVFPEDLEPEHLGHFAWFMVAPPSEANDAFLATLRQTPAGPVGSR